MRLHGTACRLIEFGERERRAQIETERALRPRNRDRGLESFFCKLEIGCVDTKHQFAGRAMQFGLERAKVHSVGCGQCVVKNRNGAGCVARPGFS